jgi:hypothetical protein
VEIQVNTRKRTESIRCLIRKVVALAVPRNRTNKKTARKVFFCFFVAGTTNSVVTTAKKEIPAVKPI